MDITYSTITDITGRTFADRLSEFATWWSTKAPIVPVTPIINGQSFIEGIHGVVLFREKPFQVQLFIVEPNFIIPEHKHPNVDSYEVFLNGMKFTHNENLADSGLILDFESGMIPDVRGVSTLRGACIRVQPEELHGGQASPSGGSFISIQEWLNNIEPSSVENDWEGEAIGELHRKHITSGGK